MLSSRALSSALLPLAESLSARSSGSAFSCIMINENTKSLEIVLYLSKNVRAETVLGKGGFGTVFKGLIEDRAAKKRGEGLTIAIKKLNSGSSQGIAEWQVLELITHQN